MCAPLCVCACVRVIPLSSSHILAVLAAAINDSGARASSPARSPSRETRPKSAGAGELAVWDTAVRNLVVGNVDTAYGRVLHEGDTIQLVRLLDKTGEP